VACDPNWCAKYPETATCTAPIAVIVKLQRKRSSTVKVPVTNARLKSSTIDPAFLLLSLFMFMALELFISSRVDDGGKAKPLGMPTTVEHKISTPPQNTAKNCTKATLFFPMSLPVFVKNTSNTMLKTPLDKPKNAMIKPTNLPCCVLSVKFA
jgi:hypothetical protein